MPKRNATFKSNLTGYQGSPREADFKNAGSPGPSATPTIAIGDSEIKQSPPSIVSPTSSVPAPVQTRVLF